MKPRFLAHHVPLPRLTLVPRLNGRAVRCDPPGGGSSSPSRVGAERSQRSPVSLARIWRDLPCFTRLGKPKRVSKRRARASRENGDSNGNRHSTNTSRNWRSIRRGAVMSKRVADLLVDTLQASGVKTCYGIVGDTMNRIAHAIDRSQIDWVHVRHELGFESIQEIDFDDVFKGCSVYCEMFLTPEQARRKTVAACQAALTKRGVAVLVVPADIANAASHDEPPYAVHARRPLIRPSDADLDEIAAILNKSDGITIYAGAGCAGAHDEVVATAARLMAPVAHTSRGKDFLEYDNPYNVGMTGIIGGGAGYHAVLDCNVLLLLGADFAWSQFYPNRATIIQIDIDPTHIGRRHPVAIGAVGNIKATLEALLPRLEQHEDDGFLTTHVKRFQKDVAAAKAETVSSPDAAISGTYLTKVINKYAAEDALFAADDGTATVWMLRHIDTGGKRRTFASLLHGTMAGGMASALGLQKCQPGRQVICLAGDGGFAMLLGDLLTTVQENLPIKIVVYDNGKLGFVEIEQKAAGLVPVYTDLKNPDFGEVAKAMGLWGDSISKAGDLEEAVQTWLAQPGPAVLHEPSLDGLLEIACL